MDKVTDDQKARIVELYTSGESTVQIGRRLLAAAVAVNKFSRVRVQRWCCSRRR
jgi:hypothetical protein